MRCGRDRAAATSTRGMIHAMSRRQRLGFSGLQGHCEGSAYRQGDGFACWGTVLAIVSLILTAAPAAADIQDTFRQLIDPVAREPHPAVGRVVVSEHDAMSKGSGTLIEVYHTYGVVLTNWHVVRDATGPIQVTFPNGFQAFAEVLQTNETWDLAALKIPRPPIEPMRLAAVVPVPGNELTIAGYEYGQYRAARGKCTQYCAPDRNALLRWSRHRSPRIMVIREVP